MPVSTKVVRFSEFGTPSVLHLEDLALAPPASGEIQVKHIAIGMNYIDIYHRKGVFAPKLNLPSGLGVEGVGTVTAFGENVSGFKIGDRVAYVGGPPGAYAIYRNLPASRALLVPERLASDDLAALIFKGLTVEYLINRCVKVREGDTILLHAAAGGVGSIASQWLRSIGATVIGTVSSAEKAAVATANGCDNVIIYTRENFSERVLEITAGRGVDVVYDSVGADTFSISLDCLRPRGTLVSFGETSGPVAPFQVASLGAKGSLFVTRPSIAHYTADRAEYELAAKNLFSALERGLIKAPNITKYQLEDIQKAHSDIENRLTKGSVILIP